MREVRLIVQSNTQVAVNAWEMRLTSTEQLPQIVSGQFVNINVGRVLRRPFCIVSSGKDWIRILYAVVGVGTADMTHWQAGHETRATLPLGNGFRLSGQHRKIVLLSGGIGIAPLANIIPEYSDREVYCFAGFASADNVLLRKDIACAKECFVCTDDGSEGYHGFATQCFEQQVARIAPDIVLTCGPHGFLQAVQRLSAQLNIPTLVTTEARMACGVGACLVCTCAVREGEEVVRKRVCTDGPVFDIKDVVL